MKRTFLIIATIIMTLIMSFSALGCNLVTVNTEDDLNQVVATVQINNKVNKDEIIKRDMVSAYLNYGYSYEQYYGYSSSQVFELILGNLINSRVYVQNAMTVFEEGKDEFAGIAKDADKTAYKDVRRYLTSDEENEALYLARKAMDDLIESYMETEEADKVGDTNTEEVRAVPTGAANAVDPEPTTEEKLAFRIDTNSSAERYTAFTKVVNVLQANGLLGEYDKSSDIEQTQYFKESLEGYLENALVEKYEKCITDKARETFSYAKIAELYSEKYQAQKKWTDTEFATALSEASATSPILYAPTGTYGFVYNLLLGADEDLTTELSDWSSNNKNATIAEKNAKRKEIFEDITAKDLRSSWIESGYDFDFENKKFTGDYAVAGENSLAFSGEVEKLSNDDEDAEYKVSSLKEFSIEEFVEMMETYLYGETTKEVVSYADASVYKAVKVDAPVADYQDKINELLFAFSTDGGSLNTYKGYLISPKPDGANSETYMQEFADYGREIVDGKVGQFGYIMVATDYGYHIMFYSQQYKAGFGYETLDAFMKAEYGLEGDALTTYFNEMVSVLASGEEFKDTNNYLYVLYNELSSTKVSSALTKRQNELLNNYVYDSNIVVKYEKAYSDLITE